MKLLFIEDDDIKAAHIFEFLNEDIQYEVEVTRKKSWQSGLIEILDNHEEFKFILLDMSMPRYDPDVGDVNEEFETFAGWDLLKEVNRKKLRLPICIITSFDYFGKDENLINYEKLDIILAEEFPHFYKGMIYFNSSLLDWKDKLNKILKEVVYKNGTTNN